MKVGRCDETSSDRRSGTSTQWCLGGEIRADNHGRRATGKGYLNQGVA